VFRRLSQNIRFYVLLASFCLSLIVYGWVSLVVPSGPLQTIRLSQFYALLAILYLYFSLLIGPLGYVFPDLKHLARYKKARRALGVSAFFFALLHAWLAFFRLLGGWSGLSFYSTRYILAILFAAIGLLVLFLMTVTSVDAAIDLIGRKNWKRLHKLIYGGGVLILAHAVMLGSHFSSSMSLISWLLLGGLSFLLYLEIRATSMKVKAGKASPKIILPLVLFTAALIIGLIYYMWVVGGIHGGHALPGGLT
jgi:DMSO/TMAO reductase YedYZ heme-binding membrane subunit